MKKHNAPGGDEIKGIHDYGTDEIVVTYDRKRCIHAEECVHGLPGVFDPNRRPWIDPSQATPEEIAEVVKQCPTGALRFEPARQQLKETAPKTNEVTISPDGPLYALGDIELRLADGTSIKETRVALCRCGDSRNKPFCDNSHLESGFHDQGILQESSDEKDLTEPGALRVAVAPNGPLLLQGPFRLQSTQAESSTCSSNEVLCRCGGSRNKPFCDGSHAKIAFQAK